VTDPDRPSRYRYLSFNAPLGEARADAIAARLAAAGPADVLDVGCGWAELLLRVLQRQPAATGLGVDTDDDLLDRGRQAARERGLAGRVRLESLAADRVTEPADLVIAVGSSHAFGTNAQALAALWPLVRPGGRLLFGDGLWDPRAATGDLALVWDDLPELPELDGLVDLAVAAGFRPLWIETANRDELDAFESGFLADEEEWLLTHPGHPLAAEVRERADEHRRRWLQGYRGAFGFAYLTLGRCAT
jgi:SAM-dependent methyltransferase